MAFFELDDVFTYQDANDIKKLWAGDTAPTSLGTGEVWLDISVTPSQLKRYNGTGWDIIGEIVSPLNIQTTDENAIISTERTDGAKSMLGSTQMFTFIGSQSNHPCRICIDNDWILRINLDRSIEVTSSRFFIAADGNVGIGTITPTAKLDVAGEVRISGNTAWHAGNDGSGSGLDADLVRSKKIQVGSAAGSTTGQWNAFSEAFSQTPRVVCTPRASGSGVPYTSTITTTGFTLTTPSLNKFCDYIAIG